MTLSLHTDESARRALADSEQWPADDGVDHGACVTPAMLRTLAEVVSAHPDSQVEVYRDWEGSAFVFVTDAAGPHNSLALTDTGRIGFGGVNLPSYFDSYAALLADFHR